MIILLYYLLIHINNNLCEPIVHIAHTINYKNIMFSKVIDMFDEMYYSMYDDTYDDMYDDMRYDYTYMYRAMPGISYVRILHASPDAPPVDIYANGNLLARNLSYRNFTEYLRVPSGQYTINVFPAGQTQNPVISTVLNLAPQTIFTVAAIGRLANISLMPIQDPIMPIPAGKLYLRFVHLSPNAPIVDITLPDGTMLFRNVGYRNVTNYIPLNPGTYTIQARPAGTTQVALYVPNIRLRANRFYTIYAVGLAGANPPLQVLIPLDGSSYIRF